jgi:hypothetical protein
MRPGLSYVHGYGWHCGRLLLWPVLLLYSLVAIVPWMMLEALASVLTPFHWPVGLIGPALFALWGCKRIRRKLRGEPFVWDPYWRDDSEVDLIHRQHDERRWRSLLRMEVAVWGGGLLIQLTMLLIAWTAMLMR